MHDTRTFDHDGKKYVIRIASDSHTIRIEAFLNDTRVNGYTYSVKTLTQGDATRSDTSIHLMDELIKTAIADVKNGAFGSN